MTARLVARRFAVNAPYDWFGFATHFRSNSETVGAEFFRELAARLEARFQGRGTDAGLVEDFDQLSSDDFDPSKVHPLIRRFYEQTTRFDIDLDVWWNPLLRPIAYLFRLFVARPMRQFEIPLEAATGLDSWLELIDIDKDGDIDVRAWIRVQGDSNNPIYVGAYKIYRSTVDGRMSSYISVAFPLPGGNLTTVLSPTNVGDGLQLSSTDPTSSESGMYHLFPRRKTFSMIPGYGLHELFALRAVGDDEIDVVHTCYWLRLTCFQMHYRIRPKRSCDEKHVMAFCAALRNPKQTPKRRTPVERGPRTGST